MTKEIFSKPERKAIFKLFLTKNKLTFTQIQKQINLRSNHLTYHLKIMQENNILEKQNTNYQITKDAQKYIPLFTNLTEEKLSPLPVVLILLQNQDTNKILFIKRNNRPYKNYLSLLGGKILHNETHKEAAIRIIKTKSGITEVQFQNLCDIIDEKVYEDETLTNSFILFFNKLTTTQTQTIETVYGKLEWIDINDINNINNNDTNNVNKYKIIPSDLWLIKNSINKKKEFKQVTMKSKKTQLTEFDIK